MTLRTFARPRRRGRSLVVSRCRFCNTSYTSTVPPEATASAGTYAVSAPPNTTYQDLDLTGIPQTYTCSTGCLQQCPTKTYVQDPSVGNNYYLTDGDPNGWWQAVGSDVYANGTVTSLLPTSVTDLITTGGVGGNAGALIHSSGTTNFGAGVVSPNGWIALASYTGAQEGYNFFATQMGVTPTQANDWLDPGLTQPTTPQDFYYYNATNNGVGGVATISTPWNVASGESYVVFVKGNLEIDQNITVATGGFLAFIVSGNVTVVPSVTSVQGLYVMDGKFTSETVGIASTPTPSPTSTPAPDDCIQMWVFNNGTCANQTVDTYQYANHVDCVTPPNTCETDVTNNMPGAEPVCYPSEESCIAANSVTEIPQDVQLVVSGSVVAWGGVNLERNLGILNNVTTSAELFNYRPDLLLNMPSKMKSFTFRWQEVPAGTFGN